MADITDAAAIRFCNERIRPLADTIAKVYSQIQSIGLEYQSKNLGAVIPDDPTAIVQDSSVTNNDGRTPISGHDVNQMLALVTDLLAMANGETTKIPTVLKVAVNP